MRATPQNMNAIRPRSNTLAGFTSTCPKCGGPARPERTGVFCPADFFQEDQSTYIHTSPDPVSEAIRANPERQEAFDKMQAAEAGYDDATADWHRVLSELHGVRIKAKTDAGQFDAAIGWRPSMGVRKLRAREEKLVEALDEADRRKRSTEETLARARRAYYATAAAVSRALGRPTWTGNPPVGDRAIYIPLT